MIKKRKVIHGVPGKGVKEVEVLYGKPSKCTSCGLCKTTSRVCVPGYGPSKAEVMIVGEAPGFKEEEIGKPFQGKAGQLLTKLLEEAGIDREKIFITNAVKCHPPENRTPTAAEIKACNPHLQREIKELKPKFVIILGAVAFKACLNKSGITAHRGESFVKDGVTYMVTYHPAALFRQPQQMPYAKGDFSRFKKIITGTLENKKELNWVLVDTPGKLRKCISSLDAAKVIAYDLETSTLDYLDPHGKIHCIGLAVKGKQWVIPLFYPDSPFYSQKSQEKIFKMLERVMEGKKLIAHNGKFDDKFIMAHYGWKPFETFDTMLASHLLDENSPHGLKPLSKMFFDASDYALPQPVDPLEVPLRKLCQYCAYDVYYTLKLYEKYRIELKQDPALLRLFTHLVMPLSRALEEVEMEGIYIDVEKYNQTGLMLEKEVLKLKKELDSMVDHPMNWNSSQQVAQLLFNELKLPILEKTKTGNASTSSESVLPQLRDKHPVVEKLIKYREQIKLTQFIANWKEHLKGSYMHPNFKIHGTVTGRLCLREGTEIMVPGGIKAIEDIRPGDLVYSYDKNLKLVLKKVKGSGFTGNKECHRVYWMGQDHKHSGYVDATGNHPLLLTSGEYIRVDALKGSRISKGRGIRRDKLSYRGGEHIVALHREVKQGRNFLNILGAKRGLREARVVFEAINGYNPDHVHHKDENSLNDLPLNLEGMTHSEHTSFHACRDSVEMRRRGSMGSCNSPENIEKRRGNIKYKYDGRFTKEQLMGALIKGSGILGAKEILHCGYDAIRRRMDDWGITYDGRSHRRGKIENNHMITHIEKLPGLYPVYDLEVEDTHNFIANELCVHNSCVNPNLQQVPRDKMLRSLITAPPGWVLVEADYSQVELRIAAMVSGDRTMKRAYQTGQDLHRKTASGAMSIPEKDVNSDDRKKAKAINFGFIYGMWYKKFKGYARDKYGVELTMAEAKLFRERFFELYSDLLSWHERQKRLVKKYKYVRTLLGRKRRLPEIDSPDKDLRGEAERQSINSPVQGTATDLASYSLVRMKAEMPKKDIKPIGLVHDAVLSMVRKSKLDVILPQMKEIMEDMDTIGEVFHTEITVPIEVEIKVGPWGTGEVWKAS